MYYEVKTIEGYTFIVETKNNKTAKRNVCKLIGGNSSDPVCGISAMTAKRIPAPEGKKVVPVINVEMMSDERWNELAYQRAVKQLISIGMTPSDDNINRYFSEIKQLCAVGGTNTKYNVVDHQEIFPILSVLFSIDEPEEYTNASSNYNHLIDLSTDNYSVVGGSNQ